MHTMNPYSWSCALLAVMLGALAFMHTAQAQDAGALDDLSLEDLLSVEVVTASKNAESLSDAPGVVSTITAREIEQFGATNLLEVLERVPGAYGIGSSLFPDGIVGIRGDVPTTVNNHVLLLLNGRPMRESTHGAMNMPIYTAFPLETIQQIEIVRGPGSVLYGSNAYAGVINIITKKAEATSLATTVGYGSFNTRSVAAQGSAVAGDFSIVGGVRYAQEENVQDPGEAFNMGENLVGASLTASFKGLTLTSFAGRNKQAGYGTGAIPFPTEIDNRYAAADLGYEQALTGWWDASLNATLNYIRNQFFGIANEKATDYVVEFTNYVRPFEKANLVVGGLAYGLNGSGTFGEFQHLADYSEVRWSSYAQLDMRPIEKLKLIAGGQFNKVDGAPLDFVPRLGAIYSATETIGAKLLYGQAFRSAFAIERQFNEDAREAGIPALKPEKVTSLDAQVFYNASKVQLAATYFHSKQKGLINELYIQFDNGLGALTYINQGTYTSQGLELEAKAQPVERLYLTGSVVYQTIENEDGMEGATLMPTTSAKAGASYTAVSGVNVGLFNTFFNAPTSLTEINPFMEATLPSPEAFNYLTAKLSLNVTKLAGLSGFPTVQFDLSATNLLGADVYMSDASESVNALPRKTGRSIYSALRVKL